MANRFTHALRTVAERHHVTLKSDEQSVQQLHQAEQELQADIERVEIASRRITQLLLEGRLRSVDPRAGLIYLKDGTTERFAP